MNWHRPTAAILLAALPALAADASAQSFTGGYSFVLPATDTSSTSPFLPTFPRQPVGDEDFVTVDPGGHFAAAGRRIRFFGTNLVADAAFPEPGECWFVAGRLRTLGYNLVRLHHLDNGWSTTGSLFAGEQDTRHLNPEVLDRLDRLVAELKRNGIYVNINLHVSRVFRRADGIPDADSLREFAKGYTYFDPLLIALQKEYARLLLTHVNPYTGKSLAADPVTAMVEITNENSLYRMWHNDLLKPYSSAGALPVRHQRLLDSLWGIFLAARYPDDSALSAAWNAGATATISGVLPGESLASTPRRIAFSECTSFTDQRVRDMTAWIIALESGFFRDMRTFLRDSLGVRAPVVGSNLTFTPPDLAAQSGMDYMDNHAYWDHPTFPGAPWSLTDWHILNFPMVLHPDGGTIGRLWNGIAIAGKPYTVSEYNHAFPNLYQSEGPLFITAYAAFHDADGVMFYDHNSIADWTTDGINGFFDLHRNTPVLAMMPGLASAYRSGAIAPAQQTVLLDLSADDVLLAPKIHTGGWLGPPLISPLLTLLHAVRTRTIGAPASNLDLVPPAGPPPYVSDTGELRWDPSGAFSVAAPSFAAVTGFPGKVAGVETDPLRVMETSGHGTYTWVSPSGRPLESPGRTLLTVGTRAQNAGMVWDGVTTVHDQWGGPPTEIQALSATLRLRVAADSVRIWALDTLGRPRGTPRTALPSGQDMFTLSIDLSADRTPWFGLEAFAGGTLSVPSPAGTLSWELTQNYPNPFNSGSAIGYSVAGDEPVRIAVYDLLGREVRVLVDGYQPPGRHTVRFEAGSLSSGVYVCRLRAGQTVRSRTMLLIR